MGSPFKILFTLILIFILLWVSLSLVLPLAAPFLMGGVLALSAEPVVRFLTGPCHLPRGAGAGIGVSLSFLTLSVFLLGLLSLIFRGLTSLTGILPEVVNGIQSGISLLENRLLALSRRAPEGIRPLLCAGVSDFFDGSTDFLRQGAAYLFSMAGGLLTHIPDQALRLLTTVLSGFMISAKLPKIKACWKELLSCRSLQQAAAILKKVRKAVFHWLLAQLKLTGITLLVLLTGLTLLGIPYAPVWAAAIALLDALPLLGTGTVLIPWSLIRLLQGDRPTALGLLACYLTACLLRSSLEPRFVGKQLGLDPLVTLAALYCGYRLWGFGGMLLSPLLTITVFSAIPSRKSSP